jgi:hypothetical protein
MPGLTRKKRTGPEGSVCLSIHAIDFRRSLRNKDFMAIDVLLSEHFIAQSSGSSIFAVATARGDVRITFGKFKSSRPGHAARLGDETRDCPIPPAALHRRRRNRHARRFGHKLPGPEVELCDYPGYRSDVV